ncbi:MAG: 3-deoxy-manno-octulosonate cytidylyltransferase [Bacteroidota bacterium]
MVLGVIPARYASTRFPGKPLADIHGKSMIQRVVEQCLKAQRLQKVVVATDDQRIYNHVLESGGEVMMTRDDHPSGTDRLIEVAEQFSGYTHYVNIQGDEPYIDPAQIDQLVELIIHDPQKGIGTLIQPIKDADKIFDPNSVKVVADTEGYALYFSRSPIPFVRKEGDRSKWLEHHPFYKHIGIYGFSTEAIQKIEAMPPASLEMAESLEQLRWLAHGLRIKTAITELHSPAVDTPEDLERILQNYAP